jgi:membrane associated rhomboid family serine protease
MGLYDRDYTQENYQSHYRSMPQMRFSFPRITPVVKWLLIINVSTYFMQILGGHAILTQWCSVYPEGLKTIQLWRYVTYQFLHGGLFHILVNMIGLYFLGPTLERHWGSRKFLIFYLSCGIIGGLLYPVLIGIRIISPHPTAGILPLIGASGSILGMLAACAILFPHFVVFLIVFPVPIRVAAVILIFIASVVVLSKGDNAGGEAAHLGGMCAGAIYVLSEKWRQRVKMKIQRNFRQRKMTDHRDLQMEVDRILKKVHDKGLHSLTYKEKRVLKQATKIEQMRR